jgi:hypothetical protein
MSSVSKHFPDTIWNEGRQVGLRLEGDLMPLLLLTKPSFSLSSWYIPSSAGRPRGSNIPIRPGPGPNIASVLRSGLNREIHSGEEIVVSGFVA